MNLSGYPQGDPPVLGGSQDEPPCPHFLLGPCIVRRPPRFMTGRAAPCLANDRKRFRLYQKILAVVEGPGAVRSSNIPGKKAASNSCSRHTGNNAYMCKKCTSQQMTSTGDN